MPLLSIQTAAPPLSDAAIFAIIGLAIMVVLAFVAGNAMRKRRQSPANNAPVETAGTAANGAEAIPNEVLAVITATLHAVMQSEQSDTGGYIIKSIRRVPAWNGAARREQQKSLV